MNVPKSSWAISHVIIELKTNVLEVSGPIIGMYLNIVD
jgi:hypothetical protein